MTTFEPIPGYSVPVVRVSDAETRRVLVTLSFTNDGEPINLPDAWAHLSVDAWKAWEQSR